MDLLHLRPYAPQRPYPVGQFRADEPSLSISHDPHPGELASYATLEPPILVFQVQPTDPPEHDPATHRAVEVQPVQAPDGSWQQAWELQELPPVPPAPPTPDWAQFRQALISENGYAGAFAAIGSISPMLERPLAPRLDRFQFEGQWQPFLESLGLALGTLPAQDGAHLASEMLALAGRCNLPTAFCEALQALLESDA